MQKRQLAANAVGLGLRREHLSVLANENIPLDFIELAPENWIGIDGARATMLEKIASKYSIVAHGLSLSIGSAMALDRDFILQIKTFLEQWEVAIYSDHLSFSATAKGNTFELLPLPFNQETLDWLDYKITQVQDILQRPLVLENISYYAKTKAPLTELEFINALLGKTGAQLLLDVNNVYVNSINHGYDAKAFIAGLPSTAIAYIHIAGHAQLEDGFLLDTHGAMVCDEVYDLLQWSYQCHGLKPCLLERDTQLGTIEALLDEVSIIKSRAQTSIAMKEASYAK